MGAPVRSRVRALPLVLLIDRRRDQREMYAIPLRDAGFVVIEAATGVEGLRLAESLLPDLIAFDMLLPQVDGLALSRWLRATAKTTSIFLVAVTSQTGSSDVAMAEASGCDRVLTKPCLPERLVETVRTLLAG